LPESLIAEISIKEKSMSDTTAQKEKSQTVSSMNDVSEPELDFSAAAKKEIDWILTRYPNKQAALLPVLRVAEQEFNGIGPEPITCALRGCRDIVHHLEDKLGIGPGETTPDGMFTLKKVECLGSCDTAPVVQINDDYHEGLTIDGIDKIVDTLTEQK
jgi:NADH:ubiquinone oxidoreductase subunit E